MAGEKILLGHGSGGRLMHQLIDSLIFNELDNAILREKKDSAVFRIGNKKTAFTTDSYVVNPIFFPGGDIGSLAVYGTVNDLSVCGARPLFISLGLIIEEGLDKATLEKILRSVAVAARRAGVKVITGDTKVVEKGSCDKIFINTSGIGEIYYEGLSVKAVRPGDKIIVSGPVGDHAIGILSEREGIKFRTKVRSDLMPLNGLIRSVLKISRNVRFMRDPTRGGLATTLNEVTCGMPFGISLDEKAIPVRQGVRSACELLGLDSLYLACEGRVVLIVGSGDCSKVLGVMRRHRYGRLARVIGEVSGSYKGRVYMNTASGGRRLVDMLSGEQLPRIC